MLHHTDNHTPHTAIKALKQIPNRRGTAHEVSSTDIDDILWATRALDKRNRQLREDMIANAATSADNNAVVENDVDDDDENDAFEPALTNEDERSLQESVEAIRKLHEWVATSRVGSLEDLQEQQRREKETLEVISDRTGVALVELRLHNPHLSDYRATDALPQGMKLKVPKRKKGGAAGSSAAATPTHEGGAGLLSTEDANVRRTAVEAFGVTNDATIRRGTAGTDAAVTPQTRGRSSTNNTTPSRSRKHRSPSKERTSVYEGAAAPQTLQELAEIHHVSIDEILEDNPQLAKYKDDEVIPTDEFIIVGGEDISKKRRAASDELKQQQQQRARSGGRYEDLDGRFDRAENRFVVSRSESLVDVASIHKCSVQLLMQMNRALTNRYGVDEGLPNKTVVVLPTGAASRSPSNTKKKSTQRTTEKKEETVVRRSSSNGRSRQQQQQDRKSDRISAASTITGDSASAISSSAAYSSHDDEELTDARRNQAHRNETRRGRPVVEEKNNHQRSSSASRRTTSTPRRHVVVDYTPSDTADETTGFSSSTVSDFVSQQSSIIDRRANGGRSGGEGVRAPRSPPRREGRSHQSLRREESNHQRRDHPQRLVTHNAQSWSSDEEDEVTDTSDTNQYDNRRRDNDRERRMDRRDDRRPSSLHPRHNDDQRHRREQQQQQQQRAHHRRYAADEDRYDSRSNTTATTVTGFTPTDTSSAADHHRYQHDHRQRQHHDRPREREGRREDQRAPGAYSSDEDDQLPMRARSDTQEQREKKNNKPQSKEKETTSSLIHPGPDFGFTLSEIAYGTGVNVSALRDVNPSTDSYTSHDRLPTSLGLRVPGSPPRSRQEQATTQKDVGDTAARKSRGERAAPRDQRPERKSPQQSSGHSEWVKISTRGGETVEDIADHFHIAPSLVMDANWKLLRKEVPSIEERHDVDIGLPAALELHVPTFDDPGRYDSPQRSKDGFKGRGHSRDMDW